VIADIRIDLPLPTERLAFFDPPWNPGNTMLMHREPHGIWRVDYQLPEGETPEQALRPESLKARIDAQLAMIGHGGTPWEMDWSSVYSARTLTCPTTCTAAWCSPATRRTCCRSSACAAPTPPSRTRSRWAGSWPGGQGAGRPGLLANYSAERVGAAREIIDEAGKSTRFMTPPTRGFRCCATRCCRCR
jgi:3-(3-hydroxy-phenyl)propionate hydroxylase